MKTRYSQDQAPTGGARGETMPRLSQLLVAASISWLLFELLQSSRPASSNLLCVTNLPLPLSYKDTCDGPISRDNRSPHFIIPNLISSEKKNCKSHPPFFYLAT